MMTRETVGTNGEPTTIVLLNGQVVKLSYKYSYLFSQIIASLVKILIAVSSS